MSYSRGTCITLLVACSFVLFFWPLRISAQATRTASPPPNRPAQSNQDLDVLKKQVNQLSEEVKKLTEQVMGLQTTNSRLLGRILSLEAVNSTSIEVDPANAKGYQRLRASAGPLLISMVEAVPYLDGYKVKLRIGNPASVTYSGFTLKAKWGPRYDWSKFSVDSYTNWEKQVKEKETKFTEQLEAGRGTPIELLLAPTSEQQLGYLVLSIETSELLY